MDMAKRGYNQPYTAPKPEVSKKAMTIPEVIDELSKMAAKWGGQTDSIRRLDKNGRMREMEVTIKFMVV